MSTTDIERCARALVEAIEPWEGRGRMVLPRVAWESFDALRSALSRPAPATEAKCGTEEPDVPSGDLFSETARTLVDGMNIIMLPDHRAARISVIGATLQRMYERGKSEANTPRGGASEGEGRPNWQQIAHDALWPDGALPLNGEKHIHKWALLLSAAYERGKSDSRPTPPPADEGREPVAWGVVVDGKIAAARADYDNASLVAGNMASALGQSVSPPLIPLYAAPTGATSLDNGAKGRAEERERCAKVCLDRRREFTRLNVEGGMGKQRSYYFGQEAGACADAIRALRDTEAGK